MTNRKERRVEAALNRRTLHERQSSANKQLIVLVDNVYRQFDAITDTTIPDAVTCRKGCHACCRQLVVLTALEARHIFIKHRARVMRLADRIEEQAQLIDSFEKPEAVLSFSAGNQTYEEHQARANLAAVMAEQWWNEKQECVFLEGGICTIYEDRPLACRRYFVVSDPELCGRDTLTDVAALEHPGNEIALLEMMKIESSSKGTVALGALPIMLSMFTGRLSSKNPLDEQQVTISEK